MRGSRRKLLVAMVMKLTQQTACDGASRSNQISMPPTERKPYDEANFAHKRLAVQIGHWRTG